MHALLKQPGPYSPARREALRLGVLLLLAGVVGLGAAVWQRRVVVATRFARVALDRQGFSDVSFRLLQVSPRRVVVEDIRVGHPVPVLAVDRLDLRFSLRELAQRHVERIHVEGVRSWVVAHDGKVASPLAERLRLVLDAARRDPEPSGPRQTRFSLGTGTARDVRLEVVSADRVPLAELTAEAGAVSDSSSQYHVWARAQDGRSLRLKVEGRVCVDTGAAVLEPELKIGDVGALVELARQMAPTSTSAHLGLSPTNCGVTVRGVFSLEQWTNAGPFEISAELGRGSAFTFPEAQAFVRFQTLRLEASGTPRDAQCRLSAGVSGFKVGGQLQASQEEGRMLSLRGAARMRQTATNQWLTATLDSDLPGRSIAKLLPRILPLVPVFFSDGGTLHAEAELTRPNQGLWGGLIKVAAEALRSSAPLTAGRVGAGAVRVAGTVAIADSHPGVVRTEISLADGYFFRRDLSVRGGVEASLTTRPPYASASGTFTGRASESVALQRRNLSVGNGVVPFEGEAEVTGLLTNPVWHVALRVPEFGVASTQQTMRVTGTAGASASIRYGATSLSTEGEAWIRKVTASSPAGSNRSSESGVERLAARFRVSEFNRTLVSNAVVEVTVGVSNGWSRMGSVAVLEGLEGEVPLTWSLAKGLGFLPGQSLTWRLETQGVRAVPDGFELAVLDGSVLEAKAGARVPGSQLRVAVRALVPLAMPNQTVVNVAVPEVVMGADDALTAALRGKLKEAEIAGRFSAEATVRFLGAQPHVLGCVTVKEGMVRSGSAAVEGLAAEIPFESGVFFRTIERPFVSFTRAKAGNVRLDQGRLTFQLTPQELFIDRMEIGWCKGSLNAYSVHLDFKNPKDDFLVYADRVDLGEALMMVMPFKGKMEGLLYGRFPVGIEKGRVKLSTGFLYSLPGQGGKLRLDDNTSMQSLLTRAGITGDVQLPLSKALSDVDFTTFKMELEPKADGGGTLRIKMVGKSNDKEWPAPVDLKLNLHGPLEELLNMGISLSRK